MDREALEDENRRLREVLEGVTKVGGELAQAHHAFEDENRRLKEALKEIAKFSPSARARRTAERALAAEPASGEAPLNMIDQKAALQQWEEHEARQAR